MVLSAFARPLAFYDPPLRAAFETAITLCAAGATWLLRGQFTHSRRLADLLLFAGLLALALLDVLFYALPAVLGLNANSKFAAAVVCGNVLVAAIFAIAARIGPDRRLPAGGHPRATAAGLSTLAVAGALVGGLIWHHWLVPGTERPILGLADSLRHPLGPILVLVAVGLFGATAATLARQSQNSSARITRRVTGAAVVLTAVSLYSLALPALAPSWVAPGLGLRLLAWSLVLSAVVRRERNIRARSRLAAVSAERLRVAGNLHDGLAQDLAFITANRTLLAEHLGPEHPVMLAASRALAVSRATITELSGASSATALEALHQAAGELSHRFGIEVAIDAELDHEPTDDVREHVVRIMREATVNAARHGDARSVTVVLRPSRGGLMLRVRDDGSGIAERQPGGHRGFGLRSIRERAVSRGGHLIMNTLSGGGTELEVLLP